MRLGNPMMRFLALRVSALQRYVIVLHYEGRKSRVKYDLPVGYHIIDRQISILTNSAWRHNFRNGTDLEVTYQGQRRPAWATLVDSPGVVASVYEAQVADLGVTDTRRRLGVRINLDRLPTHGEWLEVIRREGMSIVRIELAS